MYIIKATIETVMDIPSKRFFIELHSKRDHTNSTKYGMIRWHPQASQWPKPAYHLLSLFLLVGWSRWVVGSSVCWGCGGKKILDKEWRSGTLLLVLPMEECLSLQFAFSLFVFRFCRWSSCFECFKCVVLCRVARLTYPDL